MTARPLLTTKGKEFNVTDRTDGKFDALSQVPINVAMENPWTWIVRCEPG